MGGERALEGRFERERGLLGGRKRRREREREPCVRERERKRVSEGKGFGSSFIHGLMWAPLS